MRVLIAIGALRRGGDALIAFGLLTAAVLLSPPRDGGTRLAVVMLAAIALTGVVLHAMRKASAPGRGLTRLNSWARATVALGCSASVLMILDATVTAIG